MLESERLVIFKNWQHKYAKAIFKIVRTYADNPMDRDDLFQEIAVQIWHSISAFKGQSSEITWIYKIALNTALKWMRKEKQKVYTEPLHLEPFVLWETNENQDEQLTWLYSQIYALNLIDRCLVLLLLDDFSYKEMASILGISESNVGVKLNRIKKYLSEKSKEMNYGI